MVDVENIISQIDKFLKISGKFTTTPVEIGPYLDSKGVLNDSVSKPGLPVRRLLRKGNIPHAYQVGVKWYIPHSEKRTIKHVSPKKNAVSTSRDKKESVIGRHKLWSIGELVAEIIKKRDKKNVSVTYEYKPDWLLSYPSKELIRSYSELSLVYTKLSQGKVQLIDKYNILSEKKLNQKQSFDIWIGEPYNFAIEFDEKQHFNQYRRMTLDYYTNVDVKFPIDMYKSLNDSLMIKPGKSGFTKLKSNDPLFPATLEGDKQDNRVRQRAFRDFLKDLLPIVNGFNPTLRIPYHITNKNIKDFTESDLISLHEYILENKLV
jgi:hypothetical protein